MITVSVVSSFLLGEHSRPQNDLVQADPDVGNGVDGRTLAQCIYSTKKRYVWAACVANLNMHGWFA